MAVKIFKVQLKKNRLSYNQLTRGFPEFSKWCHASSRIWDLHILISRDEELLMDDDDDYNDNIDDDDVKTLKNPMLEELSPGILFRGNTTWRGGSLSTVDLLIKVAYFVTKVKNICNIKWGDLS